MKWTPVSSPPMAGTYMAGNADSLRVCQARYMPNKKRWVFPSAQMAFEVTHWQEMPEPPHRQGDSK